MPGVRAGCLPRVITQPPGAEVAARVGASSVALFRPPPTVGSSPSPSKDPPRSTASARVPAVKPAGGACVPEALAAGVPQDESRLAGRRKKGVTLVDGWIVGGGHGGARGCATGRVGGSVLPPAPEFGARPLVLRSVVPLNWILWAGRQPRQASRARGTMPVAGEPESRPSIWPQAPGDSSLKAGLRASVE